MDFSFPLSFILFTWLIPFLGTVNTCHLELIENHFPGSNTGDDFLFEADGNSEQSFTSETTSSSENALFFSVSELAPLLFWSIDCLENAIKLDLFNKIGRYSSLSPPVYF